MLERLRNASRSDLLVGLGGPLVGLVALIVGIASGDTTTAVFGAVAVIAGLLFLIPLLQGRGG